MIEAARKYVEACGVRVRARVRARVSVSVRVRVRVRVSVSASTPLAPVVHHTARATYREVSTRTCAPRTCASRASRSRTCRSGHVRAGRRRPARMAKPYAQHGGGSRSLGTWAPRAGGTCQHGLKPATVCDRGCNGM